MTAPGLRRETAASVVARVSQIIEPSPGHVRVDLTSSDLGPVRAGQFLLIAPVSVLSMRQRALGRPMAVFDQDLSTGRVSFWCRVVGEGTAQIAALRRDDLVRITGPLGRGFGLAGSRPVLLLGRGVGAFSLGLVPTQLSPRRPVTALLSARKRAALVGAPHFVAQGCRTITVTDEEGTSDPDLVAQLLADHYRHAPVPGLVLSCGSRRLEQLGLTLARHWGARMQTSLEAHMACGLGYCHGCALPVQTSDGEPPLVCLDGPVFDLTPTAVPQGGR